MFQLWTYYLKPQVLGWLYFRPIVIVLGNACYYDEVS